MFSKFPHCAQAENVMGNLKQLTNIWATPEYLESLRLCMNYGYVSPNDIIACSDKRISTINIPETIVLDLSLAHNKEAREIDYIINNYTSDQKPLYSARILLSMLYQQLLRNELTLKEISARLYKYSFDLQLPEKDIFYPFDNRYYSAESGISDNLESIKEDLNSLLEIYKDYNLDNYPEWEKLHDTVNGVLTMKYRLPIT